MVRVAAVGAAFAYATWAVSLPPFSASATVGVLLGGVAAVGWGAVRRPHRARSSAFPGVARWPWAAVLGAVGLWQSAAYFQGPRADHPTLSSLSNALLDSHPARAVAFLAWLVVAARLARR